MSENRIRVNAFDMEYMNLRIIFDDSGEAETILQGFNSVVDVPAFIVISLKNNSEFDRGEIRLIVAPYGADMIAHSLLILLTFRGFKPDMAMRAVKMIDSRRESVES